MFEPNKLPADVKLWFDNLVKFAKDGKFPSKHNTTPATPVRKSITRNNKPLIKEAKSQVDYEPYSFEIQKRLSMVKGKDKRKKIFEAVIRDERAAIINETDTAVTTVFSGHRAMKGETWANTKQMAIDLNNKGISVCFLPEHQNITSADAIVQYKDSWKIADFKCSQSFKTNTIQQDMEHAFEQANCCVLKLMSADAGVLNSVLDYFTRNDVKIGDLVVINKMGKVKLIETKQIQNRKYKALLKGFL